MHEASLLRYAWDIFVKICMRHLCWDMHEASLLIYAWDILCCDMHEQSIGIDGKKKSWKRKNIKSNQSDDGYVFL